MGVAELERELRDLQSLERTLDDKRQELEARDLVATLDERRGVLGSLLDQTRGELAAVRARITHTKEIAAAMEVAAAKQRECDREEIGRLMPEYHKMRAQLEDRVAELEDLRERLYTLAARLLGLGAPAQRPVRITLASVVAPGSSRSNVIDWRP